MENEVVSKNFIEVEIEKDLAEGVYDTVHTCEDLIEIFKRLCSYKGVEIIEVI